LARSPLPSLAHAEEVLAAAVEEGESFAPLIAAGMGERCAACSTFVRTLPKPSYLRSDARAYCERCLVARLRRFGAVAAADALTASGAPSSGREGIWSEEPKALNASAHAPTSRPQARRRRHTNGTGRRSPRPGGNTQGK